ncbi:primase-like DNA-binding domain-containing protein, partial [Bacillus licheniformis]
GPFLDERCVIHSAVKIEAKELYKEYKDWCYENDDVELKNRAFYRQLEIRGFKKAKGAKNKTFIHGITLNQYAGGSFLKNNDGRVTEGVTEITSKGNPDKVTSINRKKL